MARTTGAHPWLASRPAAQVTSARAIGQWLSKSRLGQPIIIDNRPGGGGISTEVVVRAPSDGTRCSRSGHLACGQAHDALQAYFDLVRDIAPVAGSRARS